MKFPGSRADKCVQTNVSARSDILYMKKHLEGLSHALTQLHMQHAESDSAPHT